MSIEEATEKRFEADIETAMEYFEDSCEMSKDEKDFFGIQEENTHEESLEEPVMTPHFRRGR